MKSLKIWSLVALLALAFTACEKNPDNGGGGGNTQTGNFDNIEQEWKLVSVNGASAEFNVYISFELGMFALYQQVYTLDYQFYDGEYDVKDGVLSGSYFDGGDWKCDYTGGITEDGKTMTLKSKEDHPVTYVYESCIIPEIVKEEATQTRASGFIPFL